MTGVGILGGVCALVLLLDICTKDSEWTVPPSQPRQPRTSSRRTRGACFGRDPGHRGGTLPMCILNMHTRAREHVGIRPVPDPNLSAQTNIQGIGSLLTLKARRGGHRMCTVNVCDSREPGDGDLRRSPPALQHLPTCTVRGHRRAGTGRRREGCVPPVPNSRRAASLPSPTKRWAGVYSGRKVPWRPVGAARSDERRGRPRGPPAGGCAGSFQSPSAAPWG